MPSTSTTLRIPLAAALRHPGNARPVVMSVELDGLAGVAAEIEAGNPVAIDLMLERVPEGIVVRGTKKKFKDTGRFDHIAFAASDIAGVRKRLKTKKVKFREQIIPRTGGQQIFLYDPDGVGVELNFPPP